jgi:hypothetical protein
MRIRRAAYEVGERRVAFRCFLTRATERMLFSSRLHVLDKEGERVGDDRLPDPFAGRVRKKVMSARSGLRRSSMELSIFMAGGKLSSQSFCNRIKGGTI